MCIAVLFIIITMHIILKASVCLPSSSMYALIICENSCSCKHASSCVCYIQHIQTHTHTYVCVYNLGVLGRPTCYIPLNTPIPDSTHHTIHNHACTSRQALCLPCMLHRTQYTAHTSDTRILTVKLLPVLYGICCPLLGSI
jgi:hypothetical protein